MLLISKSRIALRQCLRISRRNFSKTEGYLNSKESAVKFNIKMLDIIVCPLSKTPLKFDPEKNELLCEKLQIAYPIVDGIPNLIPQDARLIKDSER